ncbi:DUF38 domain-containing protein [Caenorhabditis elegans]|uniref:DUF38 domain-containing protein n=1 Tax=Caenorhabditis elegans TaxID=6239 RepID=Q9TZ28_CAEEL|nr:DUF38 domain-containing protein [Caenorhabditis elegans]CCD73254.1 DUF38 domain-containing protein [Caenorhabditis elegans]|eukprot:NP_497298.2 F-box A protein [Caenorhabditis elegans]
MVTSFINALKAKKCVHVKKLELVYCSATEILGILPWLDVQVLEQIQLSDTEISNQLERFAHLEQWKNAKIFKLSESLFSCKRIEYLFHFEQFSIKVSDFPIEIAIKIRDDLLTRSKFQKCKITFKGSKSDPVELAKMFQYAGYKEFSIEFRNYSNVPQEWGLFIERLKNCEA